MKDIKLTYNYVKGKKQIPVECYDRTVGYFRPIAQTNPGKAEEIRLRKRQNVKVLIKKHLTEE